MQNSYTDEDILQYLYNETDPLKQEEFELQMDQNIFLKEDYNIHLQTLSIMDQAFAMPNPTSIELILEYSNARKSAETIS
ncbi:MAG: hypothetical protein HOD63_00860 [Bacteroidetes bacterium]|jgi:hypothetical protein|nr:hypothetical protein [Bacteroidota bacterium]MBT5528060.1 hypothetical protein [Cytophagia bacterium]MBT3424340.1 hypothetical protein [Bacteroidota bacterium]MBT3801923.1 hypothetical protein [Bacteroidota bacterium]MBT3934195.1 hypothetical protein [Bacteroidota bacterium]